MRRAARTDANQAEIVAMLRSMGATVCDTSQLGGGYPDLTIGYMGKTFHAEVKDGSKPPSKRKLTPDQEEWIKAWRGGAVWLITSIPDALDALEQSK